MDKKAKDTKTTFFLPLQFVIEKFFLNKFKKTNKNKNDVL
jgi:hypothetical protein